MEAALGFEPRMKDLQSSAFPLGHVAIKFSKKLEIKSGQTPNRTADTRIFSPLLYRLSYLATLKNGVDGLRSRDLRLDRPTC